MLSEREILEALESKGVPKNEIARTLGIDESGVTRLYSSGRRLKLDEARALVEKFDLPGAKVTPLSLPVSRLLILHAAESLGVAVKPDDPRVSEIALDFRAFSRFATDPRVRESEDAAAGFFQGLRLARDPKA